MRYRRDNDPQWPTLLEALRDGYDNRILTGLSRVFIGKKPPTRKDDLVAGLLRLLDEEHLSETFRKMSTLEQSAVAEAAWSKDGVFDEMRFVAKYGESPKPSRSESSVMFGNSSQESKCQTLLDLFLPQNVMPRDIQSRVRQIVAKPKAATVHSVDTLSDHVLTPTDTWNPKTKSVDEGVEAIPLQRRDMERAAAADLLSVLRLVGAGKLSVTDKNQWPTPSSLRIIAEAIQDADFYPIAKQSGDREDDDEAPGYIRAFAWPMLLQAGGLAKASGAKLALTHAGKQALAAPAHETLRELWNDWLDTDILDEFRRVNVIRGQTGSGKRWLTDPVERREAIAASLADCPAGQWVALNDFSKYIQASGRTFEVTSNSWSLYLFEQKYGHLPDHWNILQLRYILTVIMEYAAALGLIDIAYIPPAGARCDYGDLWGTDDLGFLSRYDGLQYMRVTALGRYCMGLTEEYSPPPLAMRNILEIRPEREVIASGPLSSADRTMLDTFAMSNGSDTWELDAMKILSAAAEGRGISELRAFLEAASGDELPNPTAVFLEGLEQRMTMFRDEGAARLLHCESAELATALTSDPASAKTCYLVDEHLLAVPVRAETAFRKALARYGFVLPDRIAGCGIAGGRTSR